MNRLLIALLLTILPFCVVSSQKIDYFAFGLRAGAGVSTLHGLRNLSSGTAIGEDISVRYSFAWDVALVVQEGLGNGIFYQVESGVSFQSVSLDGLYDIDYKSINVKSVDATNVYVSASFGKKKDLSTNTRLFVSGGLYGSMFYSFMDESRRRVIRMEDTNMKGFDFGTVVSAGIEYGHIHLALNPQFGLVNLSRSGPKVFTRSFKVSTIYFF